jgi:phage tail-like protein
MVQLTNVPYFPYPAVAFNFAVWVDGVSGNSGNGAAADAAFQEISGIKVEYDPFTVAEGGENRFAHRLPMPTKYSNLVLKRGVVVETSRLSQWAGESLGSTLARPIRPREVMVTRLQYRRRNPPKPVPPAGSSIHRDLRVPATGGRHRRSDHYNKMSPEIELQVASSSRASTAKSARRRAGVMHRPRISWP